MGDKDTFLLGDDWDTETFLPCALEAHGFKFLDKEFVLQEKSDSIWEFPTSKFEKAKEISILTQLSLDALEWFSKLQEKIEENTKQNKATIKKLDILLQKAADTYQNRLKGYIVDPYGERVKVSILYQLEELFQSLPIDEDEQSKLELVKIEDEIVKLTNALKTLQDKKKQEDLQKEDLHELLEAAQELYSLYEPVERRSIDSEDEEVNEPSFSELEGFGIDSLKELFDKPQFKKIRENLNFYVKKLDYTQENICNLIGELKIKLLSYESTNAEIAKVQQQINELKKRTQELLDTSVKVFQPLTDEQIEQKELRVLEKNIKYLKQQIRGFKHEGIRLNEILISSQTQVEKLGIKISEGKSKLEQATHDLKKQLQDQEVAQELQKQPELETTKKLATKGVLKQDDRIPISLNSEADFVKYDEEILQMNNRIDNLDTNYSSPLITELSLLDSLLNNIKEKLKNYNQYDISTLLRILPKEIDPLLAEIKNSSAYKNVIAPRLAHKIKKFYSSFDISYNAKYSINNLLSIHKQVLSQLELEFTKLDKLKPQSNFTSIIPFDRLEKGISPIDKDPELLFRFTPEVEVAEELSYVESGTTADSLVSELVRTRDSMDELLARSEEVISRDNIVASDRAEVEFVQMGAYVVTGQVDNGSTIQLAETADKDQEEEHATQKLERQRLERERIAREEEQRLAREEEERLELERQRIIIEGREKPSYIRVSVKSSLEKAESKAAPPSQKVSKICEIKRHVDESFTPMLLEAADSINKISKQLSNIESKGLSVIVGEPQRIKKSNNFCQEVSRKACFGELVEKILNNLNPVKKYSVLDSQIFDSYNIQNFKNIFLNKLSTEVLLSLYRFVLPITNIKFTQYNSSVNKHTEAIKLTQYELINLEMKYYYNELQPANYFLNIGEFFPWHLLYARLKRNGHIVF